MPDAAPSGGGGFTMPDAAPSGGGGFAMPGSPRQDTGHVVVTGSGQDAGAQDQEAEEYRRIAQEMEAASYFEVMGLDKGCTDEDVRAKFMALVKKYHPDASAGGPVSDEVRKLKERIFARIGEAFEVLKTQEKRDAYLTHIEDGGDTSQLSGDQVDVSPIFKSEELFIQGKRLIKAQKYEKAVERLEQAMELYNKNPTYLAHLVYAKLMRSGASNPRAISETARVLVKLLEESPEMEDGWMLLGYVYKRAGQMEYALRTFERVLELNRHNMEAASEVRYLKKKLEQCGSKKKGLFR